MISVFIYPSSFSSGSTCMEEIKKAHSHTNILNGHRGHNSRIVWKSRLSSWTWNNDAFTIHCSLLVSSRNT